MIKIAAAVILYNPESIGLENVMKNIMTYANEIIDAGGKCYIIDNTPVFSETRALFFQENPHFFYYHNKNINGIAGAQNFACNKAIKDGFSWIMTMDQDSFFEENNISEYLKLVSSYIETDKLATSFTLWMHKNNREILSLAELVRYKILSPLKRKLLKMDTSKLHKPGSEFYTGDNITFPVLYVPASANIINLSVWKLIGGFDESLFIDQVDNDFSIRLVERGFKIVKFNDVRFSHYVGEKRFTIMKKHQPYYNSFRLYYIFRNHMIMLHRYPKFNSEYRKQLKWFIEEYCILSFSAPKNIFIFLRAYKDYKKFISSAKEGNK